MCNDIKTILTGEENTNTHTHAQTHLNMYASHIHSRMHAHMHARTHAHSTHLCTQREMFTYIEYYKVVVLSIVTLSPTNFWSMPT